MHAAIDLLRACATPAGFLAAEQAVANYRRVWARDGVICGIASLLVDAADLHATFRATLETLAAHPGRSGQIPSNVDPVSGRVSYGGKAGRVDATLWFMVGAGVYGRLVDPSALAGWRPLLDRAVDLLQAWEFNDRGLLYVPRAGDWADDYLLSGYVFYDQVLRIWALREAGHPAPALARLIDATYWPVGDAHDSYDPAALAPFASATRSHYLAGFEPGGVSPVFDTLGNAIASAIDLPSADRATRLVDHLGGRACSGLVPAFDPPVRPGDADWDRLVAVAGSHGFRNHPGRYHNGGQWPMVNGFVAAALRLAGVSARADDLAAAIGAANRAGDFPEFIDANDGTPGGTRRQAWSAAGALFAQAAPARLASVFRGAAPAPPRG